MPVIDAIHAGAQAILHEPAPLGGALVEETALIARWLATPGVRIVRASDRVGVTAAVGRRLGAVGSSGAFGAAGLATGSGAGVRERDSELLAEPHPTREQLFGRPGIDGRAGARQPVFPRRQPFSAAG